MRSLTAAAAAVLTMASVHAFAEGQQQPPDHPQPQTVEANFAKIYVPQGFDNNDHIQIVGTGEFENACFRPYQTKVTVDKEAKTIRLGPSAYKYGGICAQVMVDYDRVIDVGVVDTGHYNIVNDRTNEVLGQLDVKPAMSLAPDDYLYAPVSQAFMKPDKSNHSLEIVLQGVMPSNCMTLKEVKTTISGETIVVQPIAQLEDRGSSCLRGRFPYTKIVKREDLPAGRYLLHVRTINANAVNTLVDVP